jgi:hypothetical protein
MASDRFVTSCNLLGFAPILTRSQLTAEVRRAVPLNNFAPLKFTVVSSEDEVLNDAEEDTGTTAC